MKTQTETINENYGHYNDGRAEWVQTTEAETPENDEGFWINYEKVTSRDIQPTSGRYYGYRWVLTTNESDPEGYWEKI